jgi:hypothetical protein
MDKVTANVVRVRGWMRLTVRGLMWLRIGFGYCLC